MPQITQQQQFPESGNSQTQAPLYTDMNDPVKYIGKKLSDDEKLSLLTSGMDIPSTYTFPASNGRRFNRSWLVNRPWLKHSVDKDCVLCSSCMCFSESTESAFVKSGYRNWKKALGKDGYIDQHKNSTNHRTADERAAMFLQTHRDPSTDIRSALNKQHSQQQVRTTKGILSIIDIIISLGQRGIPLRGNWNKSEKVEDGNFSFFVSWKSNFDAELKDHLEHAGANAKYTSPTIQNQIIELCEVSIREKILAQISSYWSLLADETQDCSTTEQVSVCIRYINTRGDVCEDFLGFVKLEKMDAQSIADLLLSTVQNWGLDMSKLVAQAYDGASVMSGSKNGVQAKVKAKYPNATYVHCRSHVLNLAISDGCKNVPPIRNLFDSIEKLTWFLNSSAKRKAIFLDVAAAQRDGHNQDRDSELLELLTDHSLSKDNELSESVKSIAEGGRKACVPKFCSTRWTARVTTLSALIGKYVEVITTLENIRDGSTGDARSDASSYVRLLEDSQFIVALNVAHFVLSFLNCLTIALQKVDCNLADAYNDVAVARECIRDSRNDESWEKVWTRITQVAKAIKVTVEKPRSAIRQCHRSNAGDVHQSCSSYYKINVYFAFIDHVITELEERFSSDHSGLIAAHYLIPQFLPDLDQEKNDSLLSYYGRFLCQQERDSLPIEILKWKKSAELRQNKPKKATDTLKLCSPQVFPVLHKILTIFLTTPIGSVSCERSFSALRRLKLWTRSSMTEERLSGLAMLLVHRDSEYIPIPDEIYLRKANWRQLRS